MLGNFGARGKQEHGRELRADFLWLSARARFSLAVLPFEVFCFCPILIVENAFNCNGSSYGFNCRGSRGLLRNGQNIRGFTKGWFPKGWFWRMLPRNENRNEGTFGCSPGTKTGTRVLSPKPPFYETALSSPSEM